MQSLLLRDAKLFLGRRKGSGSSVCLQAADTTPGVSLTFLSQETLAAITTPTQSAPSIARFGIGSVAEAAALAGAGPGASLIVPRVARDGVTCAVARGTIVTVHFIGAGPGAADLLTLRGRDILTRCPCLPLCRVAYSTGHALALSDGCATGRYRTSFAR